MKKKEPIKITLKTAIVLFMEFVIFIIILVLFIVYMKNRNTNNITNESVVNGIIESDKKTIDDPNINCDAIEVKDNEISDETISQIIKVDINEFIKYKNFFINVDGYSEYTEEAPKNFKLLETYIINSDNKLAQDLTEGLNTPDLYTNSNKLSVVGKSQDFSNSQEFMNKFYTYVCSGLIKNHFNFENYSINIDKIIDNDDIEIYMSINDAYYIIFEYKQSECYFTIQEGPEYDMNQFGLVFDHIQGYDSIMAWDMTKLMPLEDKPIIYLYPTEDTEVSVKLQKPDNLTCSYPKYKNGWHVLAHPDGNLIDLDTNKNLYSLYYESNNDIEFKVENDGFVVKGKDTIKFLEEKLSILGLSEREAEEFIIYWLPKLEANKYNYIRFATLDEINANMPLDINPKPNTLIRILMTFKGLDSPIEVQEQKLVSPKRSGFVAVEWGGTEIK